MSVYKVCGRKGEKTNKETNAERENEQRRARVISGHEPSVEMCSLMSVEGAVSQAWGRI